MKTEGEKAELAAEVLDYVRGHRYKVKIDEVLGERKQDPRGKSIIEYLRRHVLVRGMSVLELGCAAGARLREVQWELSLLGGGPSRRGNLTGVDLVPGWIEAARKAVPGVTFACADATDVDLGRRYDLIILSDVIEHVLIERYVCLARTITNHASKRAAVYLHTPSPETQLLDQHGGERNQSQFFENTIPHHTLVLLFARFGFQLENFEYDQITDCGRPGEDRGLVTAGRGAKCVFADGTPKYTNMLFRRVSNPAVLRMSMRSGLSARRTFNLCI